MAGTRIVLSAHIDPDTEIGVRRASSNPATQWLVVGDISIFMNDDDLRRLRDVIDADLSERSS